MKRCNVLARRGLLILIVLIFSASPLFAQRKITIKLASLVPENTAWGAAINRLASEWGRITNGEVEVIVYHNGAAGDEQAVLRLLKSNQLQAAVFTNIGISEVMPEVLAISYPFLIRDNAELDFVMGRIKPELDARIQQNGFVTLAWANAGWVKIFSRTPVFTPDDLRKIKLASGADNLQMIQAFRVMGYQMIPVQLPELMVALNGGMVDATYLSPIFAAGNQVFGIAKNMSSVNLAPFMGGILMNNTAWRRIPDKYKPQLLEVCKQIEKEIEASINTFDEEAISTMVRYGLKVNEPDPRQMQLWYDDTAKYENNLVNTATPVFNREFYYKIKAILTNYRGR